MEVFSRILQGAVAAGASDIHLKVNSPVVFRVSGELVPVEAPLPTTEWFNTILAKIVPEHLRPQLEHDHEIDFAYMLAGAGRFRVNVFQQRSTYVMALRAVKAQVRLFQELHLPPVFAHIAEAHRGIVLVTGATGSGKSTTLAAMVEHINITAKKHIITLEDPIEYLFDDKQSVIEQREVGIDTTSFSSGLKNVLRQDPDVIVIGEMRDSASVMAAISAANIGHLVIATLHTVDAAKSVQRILEFFPGSDRETTRQQLATTLHAVICQRLVGTPAGAIIPAVEVMLNTASVSKLIHGGNLEKLSAAIELGTGDGMQTFDQALYDLVKSGTISQEEALANSPTPEALKMRFQGVILSESRRILSARG
ncbi:MAG: PilT/PilU family type 4a pilus ATPase [Chthoniobacter sp.]|uniref:type IV pilus twitching motility protein PilT n=1 Tax=Chthoniobacter sp. TaxID=2510640 RepID=UPI0032AD627D